MVDEVHAYGGLAGSHLVNLFRRLRRVCAHHGSRPRFLLGSGTLARPDDLAAALLDGEGVALVAASGAPAGERHFLVLDAGPAPEAHLAAARRAALAFLRHGVRVLLFTRTRLECERLAASLQAEADAAAVAPYRAGYRPDERRRLEEALRRGEVRALVTTPALEVGIDVPGIGACVLCGFPGAVAATWQQAGRAGRNGGPAAAVLVAGPGEADRLLARDPERLFAAGPAPAAFDPDNPYVWRAHLACALAELPWRAGEAFGGRDPAADLEVLARHGLVRCEGGVWRWQGPARPHRDVCLRPGSRARVRLTALAGCGTAPLGEVEAGPAALALAPGALYLHAGLAYRVLACDLEGGKAVVVPAAGLPPGSHTRPHVAVQVERLPPRATRAWGPLRIAWGPARLVVRAPSFAARTAEDAAVHRAGGPARGRRPVGPAPRCPP